MNAADWASIVVAVAALVVSALSYRAAHQLARESGWSIKADRQVWFADDPEILVVRLRNAGRAEVEISTLFAEFAGGRPWGAYAADEPLVLAGGRDQLVELEHCLRDDDRAIFPADGDEGRLEIDLASGQRVRQRVKFWQY